MSKKKFVCILDGTSNAIFSMAGGCLAVGWVLYAASYVMRAIIDD